MTSGATRRSIGGIALVLAAFLAAGCDSSDDGDQRYPLDDRLRFNHVQAKGTHNSYHVEPDTIFSDEHRYTHAPLDVQLADQGVRQFEIDLHLREDQGFEVFHLPLIDPDTTCRRFMDCLALTRAWSDANPGHLPIVFWLEPKDEADDPALDPEMIPIEGHYDELEAEILSVWPAERILAPDDLRRGLDTLPEAVAAHGWPTLGELRGKAIFSMLDSGEHREAYAAGSPNLNGKLMFVDASDPTDAYAAMFKINNAVSDAERVRTLLEQGFVVTSNTDGVDRSDEDNAKKLAATLAAGSHFISSDLPAPVDGHEYWFDMPGGAPARCNPLTAPAECTSEDVEILP